MNDSYDDEIKEFIKFIPINKESKIQEMKRKFEWNMLPKWNQRRQKLLNILKIQSPFNSIHQGLLIIDKE